MFASWPMTSPAASGLELAAHELVACGFAVVPMRCRGKVPLTPNGCKDATRCHAQVAAYWTAHPFANIGIATGAHTELFVVDIDGEAGETSFARFGTIPDTVEALTGKGRHLYFRPPSAVRLRSLVGRLGSQIDTRGDGGMVVAPPSIHATGRSYRWADGRAPHEIELAALPDAVLQAIQALEQRRIRDVSNRTPFTGGQARTPDRQSLLAFRAWFAKVDRYLGPGQRNLTAWRIAARALEAMPIDDAVEILGSWNALNCPPLSDGELREVLRSAQRSARRTVVS
jgi:hypothetical protein